MSDKPLAEQMRENEKYVGGACADMVEQFVRKHLTEQTEPSAGLRAWTLSVISASGFDGAPTTEEAAEILARNIFDLIEQGRRRIRELLVKETK